MEDIVKITEHIKKETLCANVFIENGRIRCYFPQHTISKIPHVYCNNTGYFFGPKIVNFINELNAIVPIDFVTSGEYKTHIICIYKTINGHMLHHDTEPAICHISSGQDNRSCNRYWYKNGVKYCSYGPSSEHYSKVQLSPNTSFSFASCKMNYSEQYNELFPREVHLNSGGNITFAPSDTILDVMSSNNSKIDAKSMSVAWVPSSNKLKFPTMFKKLTYSDVVLARDNNNFSIVSGTVTSGSVIINNIEKQIPANKFEKLEELLLNFNILENYIKTRGDEVAFFADVRILVD